MRFSGCTIENWEGGVVIAHEDRQRRKRGTYHFGVWPRAQVIIGGLLIVLFMTSALVSGAGAGESDARDTLPSQPVAEGKPLFEAKGCTQCHSLWGATGEEHAGPDLGRTGSWCDILQFSGALWNHAPEMLEKMRGQQIQRATLSPDEMGKLAGYLFFARFLGEPGDVERGENLFQQHSCARCHQLGGRGGTAGPRLDDLKPYMSSFFLAQALWNHGPMMAAKMDELKIVRPRFAGSDVADLVAFLRGDGQAAIPVDLAYARTGNPQAGRSVFEGKGCIKCHVIAGTGGTVGPDLSQPRSQLHVAQLVGSLWNHGPTMWAKMKDLGVSFPRFTDTEMSDLLAYLYFVQYMGQKGNPTRGADLFRQKSCSICHAVGGDGPTAGPNLAGSAAPRSPLQWASAMWNHAPAMEKKLREAHSAWPRFEDDEMRDLVEFLRSRAQGK